MIKVVILAGGRGSRISNGSGLPKPLTPIGDRAILIHVMEMFASQGFDDFIIALGFGGNNIRQYMDNYDVTWKYTLVDTGRETNTGGRIGRIIPHLTGNTFLLAYCDGLASLDIAQLLSFHEGHECLASVAAVQPKLPYGLLELNGSKVIDMDEKPKMQQHWINGGIFALDRKVCDYITGDACCWEKQSMRNLAKANQLRAYKHQGFWQSMDTVKDAMYLESLWPNGNAPWMKVTT